MTVTVKQEFTSFTTQQVVELKRAFGAVARDLANLDTGLDAMATKLNADATVTDTDYAGATSAIELTE